MAPPFFAHKAKFTKERKNQTDRDTKTKYTIIILSARCGIVALLFICNIPKVSYFRNVDFRRY